MAFALPKMLFYSGVFPPTTPYFGTIRKVKMGRITCKWRNTYVDAFHNRLQVAVTKYPNFVAQFPNDLQCSTHRNLLSINKPKYRKVSYRSILLSSHLITGFRISFVAVQNMG